MGLQFSAEDCEVVREVLRKLSLGQDFETRAILQEITTLPDDVLSECFSLALIETAGEPVMVKIFQDTVRELERRRKEGAGHG